MRVCSVCRKPGHNKKTCKTEVNTPPPVENKIVSKDAAKGREILKKKKQKIEREEIDGVTPAAGLWIVHYERKKIAGKISQVKRNGEVVWKSSLGATMSTPQNVFKEEGYSYRDNLEPEMLRWRII